MSPLSHVASTPSVGAKTKSPTRRFVSEHSATEQDTGSLSSYPPASSALPVKEPAASRFRSRQNAPDTKPAAQTPAAGAAPMIQKGRNAMQLPVLPPPHASLMPQQQQSALLQVQAQLQQQLATMAPAQRQEMMQRVMAQRSAYMQACSSCATTLARHELRCGRC